MSNVNPVSNNLETRVLLENQEFRIVENFTEDPNLLTFELRIAIEVLNPTNTSENLFYPERCGNEQIVILEYNGSSPYYYDPSIDTTLTCVHTGWQEKIPVGVTSLNVRLLVYGLYGLTAGLIYPPDGDYSTKYHIGASIEHSTNFTYLNGNLIDIQISNWSANYFNSYSDTDYSINQANEKISDSQSSEKTTTFESDWIFEHYIYLLIVVSSYLISNKRKMHLIVRNTKTSEK